MSGEKDLDGLLKVKANAHKSKVLMVLTTLRTLFNSVPLLLSEAAAHITKLVTSHKFMIFSR